VGVDANKNYIKLFVYFCGGIMKKHDYLIVLLSLASVVSLNAEVPAPAATPDDQSNNMAIVRYTTPEPSKKNVSIDSKKLAEALAHYIKNNPQTQQQLRENVQERQAQQAMQAANLAINEQALKLLKDVNKREEKTMAQDVWDETKKISKSWATYLAPRMFLGYVVYCSAKRLPLFGSLIGFVGQTLWEEMTGSYRLLPAASVATSTWYKRLLGCYH
jgi:hypothetical protein